MNEFEVDGSLAFVLELLILRNESLLARFLLGLPILAWPAVTVLLAVDAGEVLLTDMQKSIFFASELSGANVFELVLVPLEGVLLALDLHD